jgi:hypothetical protein
MFFQSGLFPPPLAAGFGLTEDENQVVELQLAVSKAGEGHWQAEPVCLGGTSGLVSHTANPFSYHVGRNSMVCHDVDEFFPITINAWGVDRGETPSRELSVDITFTSGKQYLLQGADGCMPAVDGVGSLYYSIPNIARAVLVRPAVGLHLRHLTLQGHARRNIQQGPEPLGLGLVHGPVHRRSAGHGLRPA